MQQTISSPVAAVNDTWPNIVKGPSLDLKYSRLFHGQLIQNSLIIAFGTANYIFNTSPDQLLKYIELQSVTKTHVPSFLTVSALTDPYELHSYSL